MAAFGLMYFHRTELGTYYALNKARSEVCHVLSREQSVKGQHQP